MKKLEIEKTKPTFIISVLKVDITKVGLVFSISNFFITKTPLANNWRRKKIPSCSYSALYEYLWATFSKYVWIRVSTGRDVPRDVPGQTGTGRPVVPLSRDKKFLPVPLSLCPGTKNISCPGVPLSRDKGRSKCPGTNSSVPGRPGTKWIKKFPKKRLDFLF